MKLVIIESPYAGTDDIIMRNLAYLDECMRDCLARGEAPFASHGLYTSALNDDDENQRALGIAAGLQWARAADYVVVYQDHGISPGMAAAIAVHRDNGLTIKYRKILESKHV